MRFRAEPEDFALEFDERFTNRLTERDFGTLADRNSFGSLLRQAHPTIDHYLPTLTIAGASDEKDDLTFMTGTIDMGSVSMRSFVFHAS